MPKFLYSILFLSLVLWISLVYILFKIPPNGYLIKIAFLVIFFLATALTSSILLFQVHKEVTGIPQKQIYRKTLKASVLIGFWLAFVVGLKIFGVISIFAEVGLILVLAVLIYFSLRWKKQQN